MASLRPTEIAEAIPHIAWTASPCGALTYLNREGTAYTGAPVEASIGWSWLTLVHPEDREQARRAWEAACRGHGEYEARFRLRRFDDTYRWHLCRARRLRDHAGSVEMWIGTACDIDDERALEASLRRSEREARERLALLEAIEAAAPLGMELVDQDLRILRINDVLARARGSSVEALLGRSVPETYPDLWPELEAAYRRALAGESVTNVEVTAPDCDRPGRLRHFLGTYYPVLVNDRIIGAANVVLDVTASKESEQATRRNLEALVTTIATTVEYRDPYTAGHQRRVAVLAVAIAEELGLDQSSIEGLRTAASIHDIGKISVPAEILSKPGRLSAPEFELIKRHAEDGYNMVAGIEFPWPVATMIRQHHERMDGSGYPFGLKAEAILYESRILAVADVVEATTAHRPYRPGRGLDAALGQIAKERGRLLDGGAVDACIRAAASGRFDDLWAAEASDGAVIVM